MEKQKLNMENHFSRRIKKLPRSFIRDILDVAGARDVISFAGGLPNKDLFPVSELQECSNIVFKQQGWKALQYAPTIGLPKLRELISARYKEKGMAVKPENILITSGSQQSLDLIGKVFLDKNRRIIMEQPGYLGAIQAFSVFEPEFVGINSTTHGPDLAAFELACIKKRAKIAYLVPNFQNPTGITYSNTTRVEIAKMAQKNDTVLIEDNPYGEISFNKETKTSLYQLAPNNTLLLGTFSKTVTPGLRIGWVVAPDNVMSQLVKAKQAADLHSDIFAQHLLYTFCTHFSINKHITKIIRAYNERVLVMQNAIDKYFIDELTYMRPEGGMFLWVSMPDNFSSLELFNEAIKKNVAFVPGNPFYIDNRNSNSLRLNFSASSHDEIHSGVQLLAESYFELKAEHNKKAS